MMLLNISFIINFVIYELFVTYAIFVLIRLIYFIYLFKYTWAPQTVHNTPVVNILKGYFCILVLF